MVQLSGARKLSDVHSVACVANSTVPASNNTVVQDADVVQKTNKLGIKFTTEQFTETNLLKIFNDAAAVSRYLGLGFGGKT